MTFFCRVCRAERRGAEHLLREMMFGTREEFVYRECETCGCIQIKEIPELSKYYPQDYLSLDENRSVLLASKLKYRLAAKLVGRYFLVNDPIGKFVLARKPWLAEHFPPSLLDPQIRLWSEMKILDFGCGRGHLLRTLRTFGFCDLTGLDTFVSDDLDFGKGLKIFKGSFDRLEAKFDLIMMHHSFEHLIDPGETMAQCSQLLANNGRLLIRMPIVNMAWEVYKKNWVQLDPPRHLTLYTESGFRTFAEGCGFKIDKVVYDSTAFQFWGSELYQKDLPLTTSALEKDGGFSGAQAGFSKLELEEWGECAKRFNAEGKGDQACFYLRRN